MARCSVCCGCGTAARRNSYLHIEGMPDGGFRAALGAPFRPLRIAVAWKPLAKYPFAARLVDAQRGAVQATIELLINLGHTVFEQEIGFARCGQPRDGQVPSLVFPKVLIYSKTLLS